MSFNLYKYLTTPVHAGVEQRKANMLVKEKIKDFSMFRLAK